MGATDLSSLAAEVIQCRRCPRLVAWREKIARDKVARHRGESYWGRPVPGFGDPNARLWIIGLAPAAHGGNRTGRVFTGDRSGDFLFRALYEAGFCNQGTSLFKDDGLVLKDLYISAAVRCAPPDNRPSPGEFSACRPFLSSEFQGLEALKLVLVLGAAAYKAAQAMLDSFDAPYPVRFPRFVHGLHLPPVKGFPGMLASYHPSARNTQTGLLTLEMMGQILVKARKILAS